MSIFNHKVAIYSLSNATGGRRTYGSSTGEYFVHIEPMDAVTASKLGFAIENTYKIYSDDPEFEANLTDKIEDEDGNAYTVKGIRRFTMSNGASHTEITAEKV